MKKIKKFLKYFSPVHAFKTTRDLYKEYKDWVFYKNTVEQMDLDGFFEKHNMNTGKQMQIYLGVDLPPETLMQPEEEIDKFERQLVAKEVSKFNEPFFNYGIFEYLETATERVKTNDYYGYIVMFSFNFKKFTFWKLLYSCFYWASLLGIAALLIFTNFGSEYISPLVDFFKNMG